MEVVKVDDQRKLFIPKATWERKRLAGEVEILETENGVVLRPRRDGGYALNETPNVDWTSALTVSLDRVSFDDLSLT